ncbi:PhzF family phenazine biosynthesis protein [Alteraurantiacibacter aestuarii]|uniref:PhzF family phenazine biosynthesis isomerase n=1 Tax=Alteraurantiacibacter aestuarii TaxID=650004 RepID=A0A844ZM61_9SPHN|nr:PhzF family phenazine biosynthesis protein [Alteraurantiacibacter aestuarii]MXO88654.1 PhzF family phenazine biosynthesis isomerase [Alteraurantiacibacter aestuarii]
MATIPYWHVDAFASKLFGGNQAAVMMLDQWPADDVLQAAAAENMFAETAFLLPDASGAADYELRWFTPEVEVELCGHATLASGHVVLGQERDRKAVTFRTRKAGVLEVRRAQAGYELGLPAIHVTGAASAEMLAGLRCDPIESFADDRGYVIALYADEQAVRGLDPDMAALAQYGDTMFICTALGEAVDVVSRVFVPGAGIPEDSATGSAHAALTVLWAARLGKSSFTAHQASSRGADLVCRLDGDRVSLAGECVSVVEGRFYLSG